MYVRTRSTERRFQISDLRFQMGIREDTEQPNRIFGMGEWRDL